MHLVVSCLTHVHIFSIWNGLIPMHYIWSCLTPMHMLSIWSCLTPIHSSSTRSCLAPIIFYLHASTCGLNFLFNHPSIVTLQLGNLNFSHIETSSNIELDLDPFQRPRFNLFAQFSLDPCIWPIFGPLYPNPPPKKKKTISQHTHT